MTDDLADTRRDYAAGSLRRADLALDPLTQFRGWLDAAVATGAADATAMALATVSAQRTPSVRIVLLKGFDAEGLCWYCDYRSQKGQDLAANPVASLLFYWRELSRQVRITGTVEKLAADRARAYFDSRPPDSRFSAAASIQSAVVSDRATLEAGVAELRRQFPDGDVAPPAQWGGYQLKPGAFEFWQGREGRLHDRFRYQRSADGWLIERLMP
jgi:pyridoxamine 5'-phosphate oxidase